MIFQKETHSPLEVLATGEAKFAGEFMPGMNPYYAYPVVSTVAHGKILSIDPKEALAQEDVIGFYTASDIPGKNSIGAVQRNEEPLLAFDEVNYVGQPVGFVLAKTRLAAIKAADSVVVKIEELPSILSYDEAIAVKSYYSTPLVIESGDLKKGFEDAPHIVEGVFETGAQEHAYIETNRSFALPGDHNTGIKLYCATQGITDVQEVISLLLAIPNHDVEVDVFRVGGGFGGKERGGTMWAGIAALGCYKTHHPVSIILDRKDDLAWTGKRHPFRITYKVGCDRLGRITAFDVVMDANGGYYEDFTVAIMERAMLGIDGAYFLPTSRIEGRSCKTHLPSNTAFRGFGAPQATLAMEIILSEIAHTVSLPLLEVQKINFYKEGDETPYGQKVYEVASPYLLERLDERINLGQKRKEVDEFNRTHRFVKRGIGFVPVKYGIGFTATFLNQANALVYVYSDGSISVSHGGIEMGQGLYTKIQKIVATTFNVNPERIKVETTNTKRIGSVASTAASTGTDLNGWAAHLAASEIVTSLKDAASQFLFETYHLIQNPASIIFKDDMWWDSRLRDKKHTFDELASYAYFNRYSLGAQGHYATPGISYDMEKGKGTPFSYFTTGNSFVISEIDILSGMSRLIEVFITHEGGHVIDEAIDKGQIAGGFMQGYGFATMEEWVSSEKGKPLSTSFSTYKVPLISDYPEIFSSELLVSENALSSVFGSKGVGEPPLLYGLAGFMAIRDAIESNFSTPVLCQLKHPATCEHVLLEIERLKNEQIYQ